MQYKDRKTLKLRKTLGKVFKSVRLENTTVSRNKLEDEYEIGRGYLGRLEDAKFDSKFITLWRTAEIYGIKLSNVIKQIEDNLGDDFKLMDE